MTVKGDMFDRVVSSFLHNLVPGLQGNTVNTLTIITMTTPKNNKKVTLISMNLGPYNWGVLSNFNVQKHLTILTKLCGHYIHMKQHIYF